MVSTCFPSSSNLLLFHLETHIPITFFPDSNSFFVGQTVNATLFSQLRIVIPIHTVTIITAKMTRYSSVFMAASLASVALARTDLTGCTSTDVSSPAGASIAWYVPGTGELCDFLDCGGGRAPPKYSVPGCPQYTGTASYSPSYLPGYGSMTTGPSATSAPVQASSSASAVPESYSSSSSAEESASSSASASAYVSSSSFVASPSVYTSTGSHTTAVVTSTPVVGGSNGTTGSGAQGSSGNGTHGASPTPSGAVYDSGAEKVWLGSAALLAFGALVAAL